MNTNWRVASDYDFLKDSRADLIAWQFLRRNPEYHHDYSWFITIWQQLEQDYGAPPNRDFTAWKNDPRAYRFEHEIAFQTEDASDLCVSKHDKLLIECWMGAKWGFYKFPVNPNISHPDTENELSWRTSPVSVKLLSEDSLQPELFGNDANKTAIIFDLTKNLKDQLQSAKQQLIIAQKNNSNKDYLINQWILYLRVIDAMQCEVIEAEIKNQLGLDQQEYNRAREKSQLIMQDHYREIINTI